MGPALLPDAPEYAHELRLRDPHGRVFLDHGGIGLLDLSKFAADAVETDQQRRLKFFTEAERLDAACDPPNFPGGFWVMARCRIQSSSSPASSAWAWRTRSASRAASGCIDCTSCSGGTVPASRSAGIGSVLM